VSKGLREIGARFIPGRALGEPYGAM
jgi:hypothetical protein